MQLRLAEPHCCRCIIPGENQHVVMRRLCRAKKRLEVNAVEVPRLQAVLAIDPTLADSETSIYLVAPF
jgi:hypothetical protein